MMAERYPDDATLLGLAADGATGVEYIATGMSPYYLAFRRMLYRLLRVSERANDLRVYESGDLTVGVRAGRCFVGETGIVFAGVEDVQVDAGEATYLWMSEAGEVEQGEALPGDWGTYLPLAKVQAGAERIEAIEDLRGESFLNALSLRGLGVTASGAEVSQALEGIVGQVTAGALNELCAGGLGSADGLHQHTQMMKLADELELFSLINASAGSDAGVGLSFALSAWLAEPAIIELDRQTGWLKQRQGESGAGYALVGSVQVQGLHEGALSADREGVLCGLVQTDGVVEQVVLSVGGNVESSDGSDGVVAVVKVNGQALCDTDPAVRSSDGAGFRSTDQGDGTEAVIKSDGVEQVQRGDVVSVDLLYEEDGSVSEAMRDVGVLVSVRAAKPI